MTKLRISAKVAERLLIPGDNSPLRQQFTTGGKGIYQQLIAMSKYCGVSHDESVLGEETGRQLRRAK
jgi:hypothetical protein